MIKRKYLGNPQCSNDETSMKMPPSKQRKTIYYGSVLAPDKLYTESNQMKVTIDDSQEKNEEINYTAYEEKLQNLEKQVHSVIKKSREQSTIEYNEDYITQENVETMITESINNMEKNARKNISSEYYNG